MKSRNYALLNLNEAMLLKEVNASAIVMLLILARDANFGDNGFYFRIDDITKNNIVAETGMSRAYVNQTITHLSKANIIRNRALNSYFINPHLLFKGTGANNQVAMDHWDGVCNDAVLSDKEEISEDKVNVE